MRKVCLAVVLLLVVTTLEAGTVVFVPGESPVPQPIAFSPLPLAVETAAGMVPPRPGCPDGALLLFAGSTQSVYARPLLDPAANAVKMVPNTGTTAAPGGWDGQLQRLINGDLLTLFHSTTLEPLEAALQPTWWNLWFEAGHANMRNGFRHAEIFWRTKCGVDAASWEPPRAHFDTATILGTDAKGTARTGYCGKLIPGSGGLDRPQLAVDPWGVDPANPRRQRIFLASKCVRGDDNSVQIWVSNDTGATWLTSGWRLPFAGVTAMSAVASGRLFALQCEGTLPSARLYWSDDHGRSQAGVLDITHSGLPCDQLTSTAAGVSQPAITEVSLARIGPDEVIATYPSIETVPGSNSSLKRQVYPILRIRPGADGKLRSETLFVLRAKDAAGSVLQAQLVEDDRQVAADRTAVVFWLETTGIALTNFPGRELRTRFTMIRSSPASPFLVSELSNGTWIWTDTKNQNLGDYTKGGFALDAYGIPHFVLSWPEATQNKIKVLTPLMEKDRTRYNAIWRKGVTPTEFGFRLSTDELTARNQDLEAQGYRLADINTMVLPEGSQHNAIWRKSNAVTTWIQGWTHADLLKHETQINKDFRLDSLEGYMTPEGPRYNAVWTSTAEERPWIAGWTLADFAKEHQSQMKRGFQLKRLHSFLVPEGLRYDAIWVKSEKERPWINGWALEHFLKKDKDLRALGFELADLQTVVLPEGPRYDAVWESRTAPEEMTPITGWAHLDAARRVAELSRQGWTLARLYGFVMPN